MESNGGMAGIGWNRMIWNEIRCHRVEWWREHANLGEEYAISRNTMECIRMG